MRNTAVLSNTLMIQLLQVLKMMIKIRNTLRRFLKTKTGGTKNHLILIVAKTKELIWDYRKNPSDKVPVRVNNVVVEQGKSYKYLGLIVDNELSLFQTYTANEN